MKLIYSPYYGSRPYVNLKARGGILFDAKAVGTAGLLDELELRTGLTAEGVPEMERLIAYVKAMGKAVAGQKDLFFRESFENDELGTARVILSWRDTLMMAMWSPEEDSTDKLKGIAAIEKHFRSFGYSDRWRRLEAYVRDNKPAPPDLEVECRVPVASLEPVVRLALEALVEAGVKVEERVFNRPQAAEGTALRLVQEALLNGSNEKEKPFLPEDGSFEHVAFGFGYFAHQWAAENSRLWADMKTVLVNPAPGRMNDTLRVMGRPTLRSDIAAAPQSAQLFLLGLSLFRSPVDVGRLLSYLRVKVNPIGKLCIRKEGRDEEVYYRALHRELTDRLLRKGGLDGWNEIIQGAIYDNEGNELDAKQRDEVLERFLMWEKVSEGGLIPRDDLLSYLKSMRRWAEGCARVIEDDPGYRALSGCCAAVEMLLEDAPEEISPERIAHWAEGVFTSVGMTVDIAEAESPDCIADIRELVDCPDGLVWMGFNGTKVGAYPYAFLSEKECGIVGVPSREDFARSEHEALTAAISMIKGSLSLVSWDNENGQACLTHPLLTELDAHFVFETVDGSTKETDDPADRDVLDLVPNETRQIEYQVEKDLFKDLDRTTEEGGIRPSRESYSSLDKLIQYPFDYVMSYLLQYEGYGEAELIDVTTAKGNVAHFYMQTLIEEGKHDLDAMERAHREKFDDTVVACAERKGAVLLMEENGLEWGKFRQILRKSVQKLLALIRMNHLTVVESEMKVETEFPVIGPFLAFIDLVLQDGEGNYVIFDLKWSEGSYYEHRMESRDILQLILYKEALGRKTGKTVSSYGYWVFPRYEFLTECPEIDGDGVIHYRTEPGGEPVADLFQQACNSYTYRMNQIREGIIEEGECNELAQLAYYYDQMDKNLYPLRADYYSPTIKAMPYGGENITIKGGLQ